MILVSHDRYFLDRLAIRTFVFEGQGHIGHYTGGYSDWLAHKKQRQEAETEDHEPKKQVRERPRPKKKKLKFSYKEAREYETIEEDITVLEERVSALEEEMNRNARDFARLSELAAEKDALEVELMEKMERWEYLSELAQRIEKGKRWRYDRMNKVDIEVFYACHDGVMITDPQGKILNTSPDYEDVYEIRASETIGKTVYELEEEGIFKPSLVAKVIESGVEVTSIQEGKNGQKVVATAVPIYEKSGELKQVVSYLRDITDYLNLKEKYEELQNQLIQYQSELKQLKSVSQPVVEGNSRE